MCTLSVSNVIYHKFSHGPAFYTLNGKNVKVMLEYKVKELPHHEQRKKCMQDDNIIFQEEAWGI